MKKKTLLDSISQKKKQLDYARPFPKELIQNLDQWFKIEQTYASNAIEGNTLTRSETALVVEKGLTIGGKSLHEHLEAINHAHALDYVKQFASKTKNSITIKFIRSLHSLILKSTDDKNAGAWRTIMVKISGSTVQLPDPIDVPHLMDNFVTWLHNTDSHPAITAIEAHYKFVRIHPFVDGNGRCTRLLMNLLLAQEGYPPLIIDPTQREEYIKSMQQADESENLNDYHTFMLQTLEKSIDAYLDFINRSFD